MLNFSNWTPGESAEASNSTAPGAFAAAGKESAPYTQRVKKMKLSPDKRSLRVNESVTLTKGESDPNREDDPGCIVRLIGQVVRVGVDTTRIVKSLPSFR